MASGVDQKPFESSDLSPVFSYGDPGRVCKIMMPCLEKMKFHYTECIKMVTTKSSDFWFWCLFSWIVTLKEKYNLF